MAKERARSKRPAWNRRDRELTPGQRALKAKFLRALSSARRGKEILEESLRRRGIDLHEALAKTDDVKIVKGRLLPKVRDRIPRSLTFYEKGKLQHAEIANSEVASDIGEYWSAIGKLTETGSSKPLRSLRRQRFKDLQGRFHRLEKDPQVILYLEARRPRRELFDIYQR